MWKEWLRRTVKWYRCVVLILMTGLQEQILQLEGVPDEAVVSCSGGNGRQQPQGLENGLSSGKEETVVETVYGD